MGFAKFSVNTSESAVAAPQHINANSLLIDDTDADSNSFGELPVSPYDSVSSGSSYDYDSSQSINPVAVISPAEFYLTPQPQRVAPAPQRNAPTSTVSPISIPHPIPRLTLSMSDNGNMSSDSHGDSRRKYQCSSCPRGMCQVFFNLYITFY
jgi:hypothetical protein